MVDGLGKLGDYLQMEDDGFARLGGEFHGTKIIE